MPKAPANVVKLKKKLKFSSKNVVRKLRVRNKATKTAQKRG